MVEISENGIIPSSDTLSEPLKHMKNIELQERISRVVITGIGAIMPGGIGTEKVWDACLEGTSGIGEITSFDVSSFPIGVAGEVPDESFYPLLPEDRYDKVDRFSALAMVAAKEAIDDSGIDNMERGEQIGVYMGSCYSGRKSIDKQVDALYRGGVKRVHPRLMQNNITNACSGEIAIYLGLKGANLAYSVGYASGAYALIQAFNALKLSSLDVILAGGSEAPILPLVLKEMMEMGELSVRRDDPARVVCPFDRERSGIVASEGSCVLVLERLESALSRGAKIYAELTGYGIQYDRNRSIENGFRTREMATTMSSALNDAGLSPEQVDYISASGLSSKSDDIAESRAIKELFGEYAERTPVSSIKPVTGYAISASEVFEVGLCALAIKRGMTPPTPNLRFPDEECDLDYISDKARKMDVEFAMSNAFGIDGNYSVIILRKFEE